MSAFSADERRERQRGAVRRTILDAAGELLVEEGHGGFSMRALAARSGYAAPTIYHHFGDRQGVLDALLDERMREVAGVMRAISAPGDPVAALSGMWRALVDFGLSNPNHYQALVSTLQEGAEPPAAQEVRALFESPVVALQRSGRLRASTPDVVIQALWALSHGIISLRTSRADLDWEPDLIDVALAGMLHGLVLEDPARPAREDP